MFTDALTKASSRRIEYRSERFVEDVTSNPLATWMTSLSDGALRSCLSDAGAAYLGPFFGCDSTELI
jgi:hypothetical protein